MTIICLADHTIDAQMLIGSKSNEIKSAVFLFIEFFTQTIPFKLVSLFYYSDCFLRFLFEQILDDEIIIFTKESEYINSL